MMKECDVLVVGGGPGGLAAASAAKKEGANTVVILERNDKAGGILNQCIHDGFGLIRYKKTLTGPEYAIEAKMEADKAGAEILLSRHVFDIKSVDSDSEKRYIVSAFTSEGIEKFNTKTVIFATGCRERTRGNISIPGSRPSGIYTAGVAQNLINICNVMIGKRVVILGSGDIGLIMAKRLTLEGANVIAIAEIMAEPTGLARNISQCVYEFDIPIYVKTTISKIIGKKKIEAVELSELDENGNIIPDTARRIDCDALVLSVGLIPENEVAQALGVELLSNNSVITDKYLQTNIAGVFSCGNSRRVMDLADYVSEQGELAGRNAVHFIKCEDMESWDEEKSNCMKKGFPEEGTVTCTICPNGCQVKFESGKYSGNKCPRGAKFAEAEKISPTRVVTTTVKNIIGEKQLVPVKTLQPVGKNDVLEVVNQLGKFTNVYSFSVGDEICRLKIGESVVPIIATTNV